MMNLCFDAAGIGIACIDPDGAASKPPAASAAVLPVDPATNGALIEAFKAAPWSYSLSNGKLFHGGSQAAVAADSPEQTIRANIAANKQTILDALRSGTATSAQVQKVVAFLLAQELG